MPADAKPTENADAVTLETAQADLADDRRAPTHATELLSAALAYAARGRPVFPCAADKKPLTEHGLSDATTDAALVTTWWTRWPHARIGMATGAASGRWVLDTDRKKGKDGEAALAALMRPGDELPACPTVRTINGGFHRHFALPPGLDVRNSAGEIGAGIDVRGSGGYVIMPPSPGYSFEGMEHDDPPPAPEWLLRVVLAASSQAKRADHAAPGSPIPEGRRNATLASFGGSMRRPGMGEGAILAALRVENLARCKPPLDDEEVQGIAHSVSRYAPAEQPEADAAPLMPSTVRAIERAAGSAPRLVMTWCKDTREERPTWIWPGWIPRAAPSVIGGKGGDGKGLVLCDLIARYTKGEPMPDLTGGGEPGKVLIISREDDPHTALMPRLRIAGADMSRVAWSAGDLVGGNNVELAAESMRAAAPAIEAAIVEHGIGWVIVDPLGSWIEEDGNSASQVRAVIDPTAAIGRRTGAAFTFLAHLRKAGADDPADAFAGSRAVVDAVRSALHLGRLSESERTLAVVKANGRRPAVPMVLRFVPSPVATSPDDPPAVVWRTATVEDRAVAAVASRRGAAPVVPAEAVLPLLKQAHQPIEAVARAGKVQLAAAVRGVTATGVRDALLALVSDGRAYEGRGRHGQRTVGLEPAKREQSATDRAVAAWRASPTATVREIAERADCGHSVAGAARRYALSALSVRSPEIDPSDNRTEEPDKASGPLSVRSPRAPLGDGGQADTGHAAGGGPEKLRAAPTGQAGAYAMVAEPVSVSADHPTIAPPGRRRARP